MGKLILSIVGVVALTTASWGQALPSNINLSGLGGFDREFTASDAWGTHSRVIDGSYGSDSSPEWAPYMGYTMYSFAGGSPNMVGQPQYRMIVLQNPSGQNFIQSVSDSSAPWMNNAGIQFDEASNIVGAWGYATSLTPNYTVTHTGGGFGPGYSSGGSGSGGSPTPTPESNSVSPQVTQTTDGLILQEGEFYVLP